MCQSQKTTDILVLVLYSPTEHWPQSDRVDTGNACGLQTNILNYTHIVIADNMLCVVMHSVSCLFTAGLSLCTCLKCVLQMNIIFTRCGAMYQTDV